MQLNNRNYLQLKPFDRSRFSQIGHVKPQLIEPLSIGVWRLFVVLESKVIAKLSFLVAPLTHWRNRPIKPAKTLEVNGGPASPYHVTQQEAERWIEFLRPHQVAPREPSPAELEVCTCQQMRFRLLLLGCILGWCEDRNAGLFAFYWMTRFENETQL